MSSTPIAPRYAMNVLNDWMPSFLKTCCISFFTVSSYQVTAMWKP